MDTNQQQWGPCPEGELARMVQGRRAQRRRRIIDRAATVAACFMVVVAIAGFSVGVFTPDPNLVADGDAGRFGGIACADVGKHLSVYVKSEQTNFTDGELDSATQAGMAEHLAHCKNCQQRYQQLKREQGLSFLIDGVMIVAHLSNPLK